MTSLKFDAKQLRKKKPTKAEISAIEKRPIYLVLDNILDTFNVGSIFRLAEAVGVSKIYLCGDTVTPDDPRFGHKIQKSSVGTWKWLDWEYKKTALEAIKSQLAKVKCQVIAVEQSPKSLSYTRADYTLPVIFVVGHETSGVSPEVLAIADQIVEIPLFGVNKSLNVLVALGIVLYKALE